MREYLLAAIGYGVAGCVLLYPIFTRGGEIYAPSLALARPIASWIMWILSWDVHALTSAASLFDANVFYPAPNSLAYGDALLGLVPLYGPFYLASGGNPVLSYQITLLLIFALCGAGMFVLARYWGASVAASAVAGFVYAYCPSRLGVMAELPYLAGQFLPLALLFADRTTRSASWRDVFLLALFASWQALCSAHLAYVGLIALLAYLAGVTISRDPRTRATGVVLALVGTGVAAGVFALGQLPARSLIESGMLTGRTMYDFAQFGSVDPVRGYLVPPYLARIGWDLSGGAQYLGLVATILAVIGAVTGLRRGSVVVRLLALGAVCYVFSLGTTLAGVKAPYGLALDFVPGFAVWGPAPSRFSLFLVAALAGLTALGVDRLRSRGFASGGAVGALALAVLWLALLADYRLPFQSFETQRVLFGDDELPLYATLAELPAGPVLEVPADSCAIDAFAVEIGRQLASTLHWKPMLGGYRSHDRAPATYEVVEAMANALPDPRALELLQRATGVRYLVAHLTEQQGNWRHRWRSVEGATRIGFFGNDLLFEVAQPGKPDLVEALLALPHQRQTLTGAPLAKLAEAQQVAGLEFVQLPPESAVPNTKLRAEVLVENRSNVPWPALTTDREQKVYVSYLWTDGSGKLAGGDARARALPLDLAPGESVVVPVCVKVPLWSGDLDLAFGLSQADDWFQDFSQKIRVTVVP